MKPLSYRFLSADDAPRLFQAFREAFADYSLDMSYLNERNLDGRWTKNGVSYESSVGAFDGDRMVGFIVVGRDEWKGRPAAFDAATGIVREFRGFGVAPALFDLAFSGLRARGVERFVLEVLQENKAAVGTYKKLGFAIAREFDCYRLNVGAVRADDRDGQAGPPIEPVGRDLLCRFAALADWPPSWENSFASLARIPDELRLYGARVGTDWTGFAAYYPALGWITNIAVSRDFRRRRIGSRLLARVIADLPAGTETVKMINVERSDLATRGLLEKSGFEIYARQYEMELTL
jgi:ribosomal protein S18 acetylase RimI-like enzyme